MGEAKLKHMNVRGGLLFASAEDSAVKCADCNS